jgi:hypothetical protein
MTADRPLPQYGEYATAEEQAGASGLPLGEGQAVPAPAGQRSAVPVVAPARRHWDFTLTLVLIAIGAFASINGIAASAELPETLRQVYAMYDYDGPGASAGLVRAIGMAMAVTPPILSVVAIVLSVARLRAGRIAFFIPLLAGVVAVLITIALMATLLTADPAFLEHLSALPAGSLPGLG